MCLLCLVVDAWGKIPSGLLSGNFYELGSFSQCFDIQRNKTRFETQYCVAYVTIDSLDFNSPSMANKRLRVNQLNIPDLRQAVNEEDNLGQPMAFAMYKST